MKKKILLMLCMVAFVACLFTITAFAATEVDGIWYSLDTSNSTASLTYDNAEKCVIPNVVIPETIIVNENHTDDATLHGTYTVTAISNGAFGGEGKGNRWDGNSTIESVVIPNTVTSIGAHAFRECRKLTSVTLSNQVTSLINAAFYNCTSLTTFDVNGAKLSTLDAYIFSGCSSLVTIDLGECSIDKISSNLFYGCSKLTSINGINWNSIKSYGASCFQNCSKVNFPISPVATSFKSSAFWGCSSLTGDIVLSSETTEVEDHAFRSTSITSIVIRMSDKSTQKSFNNANFFGCSKLKYAVVPDNITTFGGHAFYGCSSLEYIVIGNVTSVNSGTAFSGCNNLKAIITTASMEDASTSWVGKYSITADTLAPFADYTHGTLPSKKTVFYGATTCSACNGLLGEEGFIFEDLLTEMKMGQECMHCGIGNYTGNYAPIFVDMGYSVFELNGKCSIVQGFMIDYTSLAIYNDNYDAKLGEFGVLAVAQRRAEDVAFDENGVALNGVTSYEIKTGHTYFEIKIANIPANEMLDENTAYTDAKLHLSAYVYVGDEIYYISEDYVGTTLGDAVSYNDIATR